MARPRKADHEITPQALRMRKYRNAGDKEKMRQVNRKGWKKLRLEVLRHYSGSTVPECRCCGEFIFEFLHLDHGFGDGAEHRRQLKEKAGGTGFFYWIKANKFPDDLGFQVLCSSCDFGKKDKQYCPHELKRGVDLNGNLILIEPYVIEPLVGRAPKRSWMEGENKEEYRRRYRDENRERIAAVKKRAQDAVRLEALQHYSGLKVPECKCCGEQMIEFLQIDHIDADAPSHYEKIGQNIVSPYYLKNNNWPNEPRLQVLCVKCNFGKRIGKYCPHELLNRRDMDGHPISEEFYPPQLNWMPQEKGPERDAWLASPQGMAYKEKQAAANRGKPSKKKQPKVNLNCTQCDASLQRKQCEIEGNRRRSKDGVERFFCNMKCAGAWKSANLKGDKIYNFGKRKDKPLNTTNAPLDS